MFSPIKVYSGLFAIKTCALGPFFIILCDKTRHISSIPYQNKQRQIELGSNTAPPILNHI